MALTDSLISFWKLDEASGDALDAHGTNTLTDTNTVGSAAGKIGNARDFEATSSQKFTHATNADLATGDIDFTWAAWVQLESTSQSYGSVVCKGSNAPNNEYYLIYRVAAVNRFEFAFSNAAGGVVRANNLGAASLATWYYVVFWHDSVANTVNIQVNNGTADSVSFTVGAITTTNAFAMGELGAYHDAASNWDGLIDEVGFWKRVLTAQERTDLYNGGAGLAYPFTTGQPAMRRLGLARFIRPVEIGHDGVLVA